MLDPKDKNECSKYLSTGYLQHNVIKSEPAMDTNISKLIGWMDNFAEDKKPMDLDNFFTYVSFDITGDIIFSKPFGKLEFKMRNMSNRPGSIQAFRYGSNIRLTR